MKELRRCGKDGGPDKDRWDFTDADNPAIFPIYVARGGEMYGFCPGKATWDMDAITTYQALMITAETGNFLIDGSLANQPAWYVNMLTWFLPMYDRVKFAAKARMLLGDGKTKSKKAGSQSGR